MDYFKKQMVNLLEALGILAIQLLLLFLAVASVVLITVWSLVAVDKAGSGQATQATVAKVGEAKSWYADLWGADGKINHAAYDRLPDHLKAHKSTFAKYNTVEAFMGGYANLAQLAGKKALAPLPPDANDEMKAERNALMRQLNNVPEKPDGYGIKRPENYPEQAWNEDYVNGVMSTLHKYNAPPELAKELLELDSKFASNLHSSSAQKQQQYVQAEIKSLQSEWGNNYQPNLLKAARVASTLGLDPNDPVFASSKLVKAMAQVADMVSESKLVSGAAPDNMSGMDDRAKSRDIALNPDNPLYKAYHDSNHPQHQHAVQMKARYSSSAVAKRK
jgi:hypothetical protein